MKFKLVIFILLVTFGCHTEETNPTGCNTENPLNMQWMADWVNELQNCVCTISIFQADFNGETVFWPLMTDPLCQSVIDNVPVYNCLGDTILTLNNYEDWSAFNATISNRKIIYVCK